MSDEPRGRRVGRGLDRGEAFRFLLDGMPVEAYLGENIAGALMAAGRRHGRHTPRQGQARGYFCGMGICWDCVVAVDGRPNVRACLTPAEPGMKVETQSGSGSKA